MTKFVVFVALIAFAKAAVVPGFLPKDLEYNPHPQYSYDYKVEDPLTGDFKSQFESRDGDIVKGKYSLLESDGSERIVDYFADPINGFNAVVTNTASGSVSHGIASGIVPAAAPAAANIVSPLVAARIATPLAGVASPYTYGRHGYPYAGYGGHYNPYGSYPYSAGHFPRYY